MLDARNIFRKVSRSICDFSSEQQKNIAAIIWLYRGQTTRFLSLVETYIADAVANGQAAQVPLLTFVGVLGKLTSLLEPFATQQQDHDLLAEGWKELTAELATLAADIRAFDTEFEKQITAWTASAKPPGRDNAALHAVREGLHPLADQCRDLTKQIDLVVKLAGRVIDTAVKELDARESDLWANGEVNKVRKTLETERVGAVEALRLARYLVKQADWLQERFPDATLRNVEGLVKLVDRAEITAHDGSLTPGRYVGVAPEEVDEDFDFEETLRSIHIDLKGLNEESAKLASQIAKNFEELGACPIARSKFVCGFADDFVSPGRKTG
jgi:type I restriction enzyme M protein